MTLPAKITYNQHSLPSVVFQHFTFLQLTLLFGALSFVLFLCKSSAAICSHHSSGMPKPLRETFVLACLQTLRVRKYNRSRNNEIAKIIRALDLSPVNMSLAIVLVLRYMENKVNMIDISESKNLPYYLIVVALVLANKYINDQSYTLKLWLSILKKCLALESSLLLLHQMEVHMLAALNYRLTVDHDLLLWYTFDHLDHASVQKLRVAAECERPGACYATNTSSKRTFDAVETTHTSKKYAKLDDTSSMAIASFQLPLGSGLATPPSSQPSPSSYAKRQQRQPQKLHSAQHILPHVVAHYSSGYGMPPSSVLPGNFLHSVPPIQPSLVQHMVLSSHTPTSSVGQPLCSTGYSSVFTTPCSLPLASYTPSLFAGAYAPVNYT